MYKLSIEVSQEAQEQHQLVLEGPAGRTRIQCDKDHASGLLDDRRVFTTEPTGPTSYSMQRVVLSTLVRLRRLNPATPVEQVIEKIVGDSRIYDVVRPTIGTLERKPSEGHFAIPETVLAAIRERVNAALAPVAAVAAEEEQTQGDVLRG